MALGLTFWPEAVAARLESVPVFKVEKLATDVNVCVPENCDSVPAALWADTEVLVSVSKGSVSDARTFEVDEVASVCSEVGTEDSVTLISLEISCCNLVVVGAVDELLVKGNGGRVVRIEERGGKVRLEDCALDATLEIWDSEVGDAGDLILSETLELAERAGVAWLLFVSAKLEVCCEILPVSEVSVTVNI